MEAENKLIFVVDNKASKSDVRRSVEKMFKVKVTKINTYVNHKGLKKAYVKLAFDTPAIDVATQMGLM